MISTKNNYRPTAGSRSSMLSSLTEYHQEGKVAPGGFIKLLPPKSL